MSHIGFIYTDFHKCMWNRCKCLSYWYFPSSETVSGITHLHILLGLLTCKHAYSLSLYLKKKTKNSIVENYNKLCQIHPFWTFLVCKERAKCVESSHQHTVMVGRIGSQLLWYGLMTPQQYRFGRIIIK